ncbi:MAG: GNAT family N-acetyltransferase [Deltaproteobacteria bacterium]|nr:GNAT family N-acetyltransferase [Deltaproteobacteria bacterium]
MLRKATPEDIPGILALVKLHPDTLLPRTAEEYRELVGTTWVVDQAGQIVGCATLEVYSPKIAEIRSVAVHPDFQKNGLGAQLVNAAVAEGRKRNIREIMVVTSSPDYFRSLGFGACLNEKYALFLDGK